MIDNSELQRLLNYDPETGLFYWKVRMSNRVKAGDLAGVINGSGYRIIAIKGKIHYAHRLAFLWMTGRLPGKFVDHVDGDRSNNIWVNLREASALQNAHNQKLNKSNTSGIKGVHYDKATNKWLATLKVNGKPTYLGVFSEISQAEAVIKQARQNFHGDFSNHG
ncbi:HNH endonuclease [Rosenbergiella nectarea]|uniref:HNH endonuclease n=1 Tax=Rosenbergiella nectarea TaxID=988801 RepID=UPI001F4E39BA|nr:HNH endonuclease [Rosenbergiella nectarea]